MGTKEQNLSEHNLLFNNTINYSTQYSVTHLLYSFRGSWALRVLVQQKWLYHLSYNFTHFREGEEHKFMSPLSFQLGVPKTPMKTDRRLGRKVLRKVLSAGINRNFSLCFLCRNFKYAI